MLASILCPSVNKTAIKTGNYKLLIKQPRTDFLVGAKAPSENFYGRTHMSAPPPTDFTAAKRQVLT